jgi:hypothetical protein
MQIETFKKTSEKKKKINKQPSGSFVRLYVF